MNTETLKTILGEWYDNTDESPERAEYAYQEIAKINEKKYETIPVEVIWQKEDPYDSYEDMKKTVEKENKLRVFSGGSEPKFISQEQNVKGRAVHDWFGHLDADCDFSLAGEFEKYTHVKNDYPAWTRPLLFTEIVGQRAAASYYENGFFDNRFEQKATFAPNHVQTLAKRVLSGL